jgi:hypothetical protein
METLRIDTGRVNLRVEDSEGNERGIFSFNPGDVNTAERFLSVQEEYKKLSAEYDEEIKNATTTEQQLAVLKRCVSDIEGLIDVCFGEGSSEILFGEDCSLTMFLDFFDGITPYFEKASKDRVEKFKSRLNKK